MVFPKEGSNQWGGVGKKAPKKEGEKEKLTNKRWGGEESQRRGGV